MSRDQQIYDLVHALVAEVIGLVETDPRIREDEPIVAVGLTIGIAPAAAAEVRFQDLRLAGYVACQYGLAHTAGRDDDGIAHFAAAMADYWHRTAKAEAGGVEH